MFSLLIYFYGVAVVFSASFLIISALVSRRKLLDINKPLPDSDFKPKVSILKPLKGLDDGLKENLRSYFELDYPNYEIIFGLQSPSDPAALVALELLGEYDHIRAKIIIEEQQIGLNPKINNLHNMMPAVRGSFILISDSNTRVEKDFLDRLVAEFIDQSVGIVTASIRGKGEHNITAAMENLHLNTFVTPSVFVAEALTDIPIVIGKSILMPRYLLERLGGFKAFKNHLAEDYLLGRRVKELGYKVKCAPVYVNNINHNWPVDRFANRHTRWAKMRRNMHLHHYLLESLSNPVTLSAILMLLLQNWTGVAVFAGTSILKILHDAYISRLMKSQPKWFYFLLIPVKDIAISIFWLIPFFSRHVVWRENRFRINKETLLRQAA